MMNQPGCCDVLQATYYIPSANQSTPYGKLYFKCVNVLNKRKKLGVPRKRGGHGKSNPYERYDLSNLEILTDGTYFASIASIV